MLNVNTDNLVKALDTGIRDTLENMLFVEPEPPEEPQQRFELCAAVDAKAPVACRMTLSLDKGLAEQLAEQLYSMDTTDISESMMLDVAKELLNTVAGVTLAEVSDAVPIELSLPYDLPPDDSVATAAEVRQHYAVEDGQIQLAIQCS